MTTYSHAVVPSRKWDESQVKAWLTNKLQDSSRINAISSSEITQQDFEDLDWNAREALYMNNKREDLPKWLRTFVICQDPINQHLLCATEKMLHLWETVSQNQKIRYALEQKHPEALPLVLNQSFQRLQQAKEKSLSLCEKTQLLRQFSIRQIRFYQHFCGIFSDLHLCSITLIEFLADFKVEENSLIKLNADLEWHTFEVARIIGTTDRLWTMKQIVQIPRFELNRLLSILILLHENTLKLCADRKFFQTP